MKRAIIPAALLAGLLPSLAAAMCYTVYDAQNRIVFRGMQTPVDLSGPVTTAMKAKFPGAQLIIANDTERCLPIEPTSPVDVMQGPQATDQSGPTPIERR